MTLRVQFFASVGAILVTVTAIVVANPASASAPEAKACPRVVPSIPITLGQAATAANSLLGHAYAEQFVGDRSKTVRIDMRAVISLASGSSTFGGGFAQWRSRVVTPCGLKVADASWLVQFYAQSNIARNEPISAIVIRGIHGWILWYKG